MKRFGPFGMALVLGLPGCATIGPAPSPFKDPAAFEGREVHLCGQYQNGGLYPGRFGGMDLTVQCVPEEFYHVTNWGRKCLTGIVKRTGYDPSDPNIICNDYCRVWAIDISASLSEK